MAVHIGVARRDVTPPRTVHARCWGAAVSDFMDGVHRPFTLTALTVGETAALVALDGSWWRTRADEWAVREGAARALGIPAEAIFLALSHTHAGPTLSADVPGGAAYLETVRQAIVSAVTEARQTAEAATIEWAVGRCDLATHRDLPEPGGPGTLVGWNPEVQADDTVSIARVMGEGGEIRAVLVHYACHPTTLGPGNRLLSPDYIGAMQETVESDIAAPCLFVQGASGELSPAEQYSADPALADRHGRRLGYAVLSALEGMGPPGTRLTYDRRLDSGAPLALHKRESIDTGGDENGGYARIDIALVLKPQITAVGGAEGDDAARERARRAAQVRASVGDGAETVVSLHTLTLGDRTLLGVPGEAYSALQQALSSKNLLVCNCTNGWLGYFPPQAVYDAPAVYAAQQSPFAPGCHERLCHFCSGRSGVQ
jgi:hypothetical protein